MKAPNFTTIIVIFGLLAPLTAQNFDEPLSTTPVASQTTNKATGNLLASGEVPQTSKVQASIEEVPSVYSAQDTITLEPRQNKSQRIDSVVDLAVLRQPSPFRNIARGRESAASEVATKGVREDLELISATYRVPGVRESSCLKISLSVEQRIKLDSSKVLEIVEAEISSNPSCTCEIVKAAIKAADADTELVVSIVETSISASPESMSMASQCAIAAVPESLASVQALLSTYDANAGESGYSSKSAKSAKVGAVEMPDSVAAIPNPLDFPGQGPVGPAPGGQPTFRPLIPVVTVSPVTRVSP